MVLDGNQILLISNGYRKPSSKLKDEIVNNDTQNSNSKLRNRSMGSYSGNSKNVNKRLSSIAVLTRLYFDSEFSNETMISIQLQVSNDLKTVNGTTGKSSLNDIFWNVDKNPKIPVNEFHIFYEKVTCGFFGDSNTGISIKFDNSYAFSIPASKSKLKEMTSGRHILTSIRKGKKSVIYFEGCFLENGKYFKAKHYNHQFAQSIYMRPDFN